LHNFTAIDFETANANPNSICQIGLIRIENGLIVKEIDLLVQPPRNYYWSSFINVHGISPTMTAFSPRFSELYPSAKYCGAQHRFRQQLPEENPGTLFHPHT